MPNTSNAAKALRRNARRAARNQSTKSRLKTFEKKYLAALATSDAAAAEKAFREMSSVLGKAVKKGVIKKQTANRKRSRHQLRFNAAVKAKAAAPATVPQA